MMMNKGPHKAPLSFQNQIHSYHECAQQHNPEPDDGSSQKDAILKNSLLIADAKLHKNYCCKVGLSPTFIPDVIFLTSGINVEVHTLPVATTMSIAPGELVEHKWFEQKPQSHISSVKTH